jgi:hypothetical protein
MNPFYDLRALPPDVPVLVGCTFIQEDSRTSLTPLPRRYDDGHLTMEALAGALNGDYAPTGHVPFSMGPKYSPQMLGLPSAALNNCV